MKTDVNQYFRNGKIQNKEGIQSNEILLLNKQNKQNKASDEKDSNKDVNNKIHEIEENIKTNNNLDIKEGEKNNYEIGIDFNSINSIQIQPLINQNEEGLNQDSPEVSPIKRDSDISNYVLKIQDDAAGYKKPTRMDWYPKLNAPKPKNVKLDEIKEGEKKDEEIKEVPNNEVEVDIFGNTKDVKPMNVGGGEKDSSKNRYQINIVQVEELQDEELEQDKELEQNNNQNENELEQISEINIENKTISEESLKDPSRKISEASVILSK